MSRSFALFALVGCVGFATLSNGCSSPTATSYSAPDRAAGARAPRTGVCQPAIDPTDCLLPWPSSTWTKKDGSSPTGIRVAVDLTSLNRDDDPTTLNRADGFSRLTPIVTGFSTPLDPPPSDAVRLFLVEPGRATTGQEVPLGISLHVSADDPTKSLLVATPKRLLEPGAEYVVIVSDSLHAQGGAAIAAARATQVALGIADASSQAEADERAYFAPERALLQKSGVAPSHVLRMWDFTTRSVDDGTRRLRAMRDATRAAVSAGATTVTIDSVTAGTGSVSLVVEGHLSGLPTFMTPSSTAPLTLDAKGLPISSGVHDAPFRIAIPNGTSTYNFVMYGHGTGGAFHDAAFDQELAQSGMAKVGISFYGWTQDDAISTFISFSKMSLGTHHSSAMLMQAVADGAAIEAAISGSIGDALSAPTLAGSPNPAAGRRPSAKSAVWAGGSLGGTMGLVYSCANPDARAAVLNVPGAGWTHFIAGSSLWSEIEPFVVPSYGDDLSVLRALYMSQGNWDDVDGGIWKESLAGRSTIFLVQESIGDPVLPNVGTENVARTTGAVQIGGVLVPIDGVTTGSDPVSTSALTQYHVAGAVGLEVHGFAAKDTPAGRAAREQIRAFIASVFAGAPQISVPAACVGKRCEF